MYYITTKSITLDLGTEVNEVSVYFSDKFIWDFHLKLGIVFCLQFLGIAETLRFKPSSN